MVSVPAWRSNTILNADIRVAMGGNEGCVDVEKVQRGGIKNETVDCDAF
jgi:hypothetical protein